MQFGENLNDGFTDATQAIDSAINFILKQSNISTRFILYFPSGTYKVSRSVGFNHVNTNATNGNGNGITIWGENKASTTIKLSDNNPLFQDVTKQRPVFTFADDTINLSKYTNIAFMNSLMNLTIDVGQGNKAAIGIRYIANNQGILRDVNILSSDPNKWGYAGIDMMHAKIPGPAYLNNITVDGFDYGIVLDNQNYGTTMENVEIYNTAKAGIYNKQHITSINKLKVQSSKGKGVINDHSDGVLTLLNSDFSTEGNDTVIHNKGYILLDNVKNSVNNKTLVSTETVLMGNVPFYVKNPYQCLYSKNTLDSSMLITPLDEPFIAYDDTANWVNVADFGYTPGSITNPNYNDCGPAIKAAINYMNQTGNEYKTTLYFSKGIYRLNTNNIRIYGNVKRIFGSWASIYTKTDVELSTNPLFIIDNTDYDQLIVEAMNLSPQGTAYSSDRRKKCAFFENKSSKNVVLRNIYAGHGKAYTNNGATGKLFLSDVSALSQYYYCASSYREIVHPEAQPQFDFGNQTVYARQLNPEQRYTHILSDGGKVWILGIKTEEPGTVIHAKNNALLNLYGGTILSSFVTNDDPILKIENSRAIVSCAEHVSYSKYTEGAYYNSLIAEIRGDSTKYLLHSNAYKRNTNYASVITYYMTNANSQNEVITHSLTTKNEKEIKLYPNPVVNGINYELTSKYQSYTIINSSGLIIKQGAIESENGSIDFKKLQSGIYIIRFISNDKISSALFSKK